VVPGITSAISVPAYAGIPVTYRGLASSFAVITGHEDPGKDSSSINWKNLATGIDTLVFLMGMKNLPEIAAKLLENGRHHDTPVAIIKNGTKPNQKTLIGNLNNIVEKVNEHQFGPPAIIVVGEVVRLREKLRWFDNRPLFGKRILVTRARHQASVLSKLLSDRGAQPIELPVIEVHTLNKNEELDRAVLNLKYYQWIGFTSVNGVEAFFQRLERLQLDVRALHGLKIGAIGPATAKSLQAKGIIPDYVPEVYTGKGFVAGLKNHDIIGMRFLLPRADIADEELADGINKLGAEVHEIVSYKTTPVTNTISQITEMLSSGKFDVITFTSSSTVTNLVSAFKGEQPSINNAKVACIGPKTSETAIRAGLKVDIFANEHTIPGLVAAIEQHFEKEV
jgi:uroporphyrinogen III methyltransferase/synthase